MKPWWSDLDLLIPDKWLDQANLYRRKVPILYRGTTALLVLTCHCGVAWMAPAGVPCRGCGRYCTQEEVERLGFNRLKRGKGTVQHLDGTPFLTRRRKKSVT